jgi:hypothetical protein
MSDRLALTEAIEDAGIEHGKATRIASVIFDAIHQNVATRADVQSSVAALRADITAGRSELAASVTEHRAEMHSGFARQDVAIERLRSSLREMESRLLVRLGGIVVAGVAAIVALQHLWPSH